MEAAFHRDNRNSLQQTTDQATGMTRRGRDGEVRNVTVRDRRLMLDLFGESTETRSQDHPDSSLTGPRPTDELDRFTNLLRQTLHDTTP